MNSSNFSLMKSISEAADEKQTGLQNLAINIPAFEHPAIVCEMAEDFLNEIAGRLKSNAVFAPEEVQRIAPVLATLQLLTKEDTREAILSKFKGNASKNLIAIAKSVAKPSEPAGRVDQILQKIGQVNARNLMDKNTAILNDTQSMGRKQLLNNVEKLTQWFQSYASKDAEKNQKPQMMQPQQGPETTAPPAANNQQQTSVPGNPAAPQATGQAAMQPA